MFVFTKNENVESAQFHFQVKNATDTSNFDDYPDDEEEPPDDLTGWDKEF